MEIIKGGLEKVPGYSFSAVKCGIKYPDRLDLSLIFSPKPCNAGGVFTTNRIFAAPVRLCRERIASDVHGILINANNANACTGEEGYANTVALTGEAAKYLDVPADSILMASTGVIGVQLPAEKIKGSIPGLASGLSPENGTLIPRAIMTTDTFPKEYAVSFGTGKGTFHVAGIAKGAGMIAPDMATLLAFILTDIPLEKPVLDASLKRCVDKTLNAITIDGDMSTNDTALLLCPKSDRPVRDDATLVKFESALLEVMNALGVMIVRDGEGATKLITVTARGAVSVDDARRVARSVAESLLVKTAMFGNDPNWGRIACAAGYSGVPVDERTLSIYIDETVLFSEGAPSAADRKKVSRLINKKEVTLTVDLGMGKESFTYYTSDISYDYVKINAEYTT